MRFYLTSTRTFEIERASELGFVHGVVVPREDVVDSGRNYEALLQDCSRFSFPFVGIEATALDSVALTRESQRMSAVLGDSLTFLMPMTLESVKTVAGFKKVGLSGGIKLVSSTVQALVAARAGADYVCISAKLLGSIGIPIGPLITEVKELYHTAGLSTRVLVEDIQDVAQVSMVASAHADGVVCSWHHLQGLAYHPLTDQGIGRTLSDWGAST